MRSGQWELRRRRVVETRPQPPRRVVAVRAGLRELRRFMIRIHCRGVIGNVAGHAFLSSPLVNAFFVAIYAGKRCMATGQRKLGIRSVIEAGSGPLTRGMTDRAIFRKSGGAMVGVLCAVVISDMTRYTFLRFTLIDSVLVAVRASKCCM